MNWTSVILKYLKKHIKNSMPLFLHLYYYRKKLNSLFICPKFSLFVSLRCCWFWVFVLSFFCEFLFLCFCLFLSFFVLVLSAKARRACPVARHWRAGYPRWWSDGSIGRTTTLWALRCERPLDSKIMIIKHNNNNK